MSPSNLFIVVHSGVLDFMLDILKLLTKGTSVHLRPGCPWTFPKLSNEKWKLHQVSEGEAFKIQTFLLPTYSNSRGPLSFIFTFWIHLYSNNIVFKSEKKGRTSSAGSAPLGDTSWARLTTKLIRCLRIRWGDTNPIWNIWSVVKTRVGTPRKILRYLRSRGGHRTFYLRVSC